MLIQLYVIISEEAHKTLYFDLLFLKKIISYTCLFPTVGTQGVLLAQVNCWDWPGVCATENVTQFPTIKIYEKGERWVMYDGMWGTEELTSFIML